MQIRLQETELDWNCERPMVTQIAPGGVGQAIVVGATGADVWAAASARNAANTAQASAMTLIAATALERLPAQLNELGSSNEGHRTCLGGVCGVSGAG
eukprot:CAMPEP_0182865446 /NCGR_PEP_ID=MMETSP0034_2-20130328/7691_1 /TAXON_ID=156128 /ORGANISM="Nephroselmis pyriformis, Strain CCMP717" /LENGTH=97 /DNA_ID=CAMNT_0024997741 /DNA_START=165 /DNA_END=455 /DNA_ORIENTATION=+